MIGVSRKPPNITRKSERLNHTTHPNNAMRVIVETPNVMVASRHGTIIKSYTTVGAMTESSNVKIAATSHTPTIMVLSTSCIAQITTITTITIIQNQTQDAHKRQAVCVPSPGRT